MCNIPVKLKLGATQARCDSGGQEHGGGDRDDVGHCRRELWPLREPGGRDQGRQGVRLQRRFPLHPRILRHPGEEPAFSREASLIRSSSIDRWLSRVGH